MLLSVPLTENDVQGTSHTHQKGLQGNVVDFYFDGISGKINKPNVNTDDERILSIRPNLSQHVLGFHAPLDFLIVTKFHVHLVMGPKYSARKRNNSIRDPSSLEPSR